MPDEVPIKALKAAKDDTLIVESLSGEIYEGKLITVEDDMNLELEACTVTYRDGKKVEKENVYIRGTTIRVIILPDKLENNPMFGTLKGKNKGRMSPRQLYSILFLITSALYPECNSLNLRRFIRGVESRQKEKGGMTGNLDGNLAVKKPFVVCDAFVAFQTIKSKAWRSISCITCLVPTDVECQKSLKFKHCQKSSTKNIPIYQNLMEFGIDPGYFPKLCKATFKFPHECTLKLEITEAQNIFKLKLLDCRDTTCEPIETKDLEVEDINDSISFVFKAFANGSILIHATASKILATHEIILHVKPLFWIEECSCKYNTTTDILYFKMTCNQPSQLLQPSANNSLERFATLPLILPCSSGGFAVDPSTGKFTVDIFYKDRVFKGIDMTVVQEIFYVGLPKCVKWPIQSSIRIVPAYLTFDGKPKPYAEMKVQIEDCSLLIDHFGDGTTPPTVNCKDHVTERGHRNCCCCCCCCPNEPAKLIRNNFFNFFYLGL